MTATIASESLGNLNTLNLNLQSLSGITFDQLKEATEACGGSVVALPDVPVESILVEPQEPIEQPKKRGRKKRDDGAPDCVYNVPAPRGVFTYTEPSEEQKPIEPHPSQPHSGAALLEIQSRFELFGFRIPMPALSGWMPQTVRELEKTLREWEKISVRCNNCEIIPREERENYECAPSLISKYDTPSDEQIDVAFDIGVKASDFIHCNESKLLDERNPFVPDTQLGQAWVEGFRAGKKNREASIHPVQKPIEQKPWVDPQLTTKRDAVVSAVALPITQPSSRSTLADYEAGRSSARQEAMEKLLDEIFDENKTIKSLADEIKELKANLKELNETREEHVTRSSRLMDELEKVKKGEFQEGLPFGE